MSYINRLELGASPLTSYSHSSLGQEERPINGLRAEKFKSELSLSQKAICP
jgi:hypothetical protein